MATEMDKALDDYRAGRLAPEGCRCEGTGWNPDTEGGWQMANANASVHPCPHHRPEQYREWLDGTLTRRRGKRSRREAAAGARHVADARQVMDSPAAEPVQQVVTDWAERGRKDLQ